jgi:hypothetical protein
MVRTNSLRYVNTGLAARITLCSGRAPAPDTADAILLRGSTR